MPSELQRRLQEKSKPVEFERTSGLFAATTTGVGALMGAGLYVLVGIAAAEAGPSLWLAYLICGGLTFLSAMMYADLARRMPVSGGGYVYAYDQLGSFWGFMVGWHLALGSVFACALYAYGFASYTATFLPAAWSSLWSLKGTAAGLVALLIGLGLRGGRGGDKVQGIFTWGNLLVLLVLAAVALPHAEAKNFSPAFPNGAGGVGAAISLIYISFFGYQLIANRAEEIREPTRNVPWAMLISLGIALVGYVLVSAVSVAAVPYTELAASDAPLVLVATRGLGRFGASLIGVGGVLASGAALNSTLLSQGRQLYAMGRDRLLPKALGTVSRTTTVPVAALLAGAACTIVVVVLADLAFIAKSANFTLLFSMLPISVALHRLNRQLAAAGTAVPLSRRAVPWAALVANTGLLLTLDAQSLLFGGVLAGAGGVVFLSYSHSSEKRGRAGFSVSLVEERAGALLSRGERVLVPMANPLTQESLFSIAQAVAAPTKGEIVALTVVVAADTRSPREALRDPSGTREAVELLERASRQAEARGVTIRPVVRGARRLAEGITHAAVEERCGLIVMGWATEADDSPSKILQEVASHVRADFVFLRLVENVLPKRIGVSLGGRANLPLMVRVAGALAEQYDGEVTYLNVMPRHYERRHLNHARRIQTEAIGKHHGLGTYRTELLRSDSPLDALVERSQDFDLLVIGSAPVGRLSVDVVGTFSPLLARQSRCSVVIVRHTPALGRLG